jgi:NodT family efflux transporter outer membrane factor (OMF) lipoprotein
MLQGNLPREPNRKVPGSYGSASTGAPPPPEAPSVAKTKWSDFFTSPELKTLIDAALKNNQELNLRLQEIIIARSEVGARRGELWPKVNARVGAGIEKVGKYTSQGQADEANGVAANLPDFAFGLTASWEIDIWGKLRNAVKAANLRYLSSIEARNFMVTQIVAELARTYYELIAIDNQLDVVKRNIEIQNQALAVVRIQKQAARVTELAVQRFEAEVLKNRSRLYNLEQQRVQAENRINFLVGRYPQPVARNAEQLNAPLPDALPPGLPPELLENRPDVRQAELDLQAAKLDVKIAKKAFYPSLSLDAGVGYRSSSPSHLVATPDSLIYNLFGNLTAPLFNWAGLMANFRATNARQIQAVFSYERTLLQAFTEVANQLANIDNLRKAYELQADQVATLARSIDISNVLFQSARADYMEVLLTRRDSLDAQMELIETKKRQYEAMVNVYQALGGGWRPGT